MKENFTKSECSETWLEEGIIVQDINPKIHEINMDIALQLIADRRHASGDIWPRVVLVIVNNAINVDSETKKFYRESQPYEGISAIAMLVDNFIAKIIGNLVFKLQKNQVPIELFNNKEKALKWLQSFSHIQ